MSSYIQIPADVLAGLQQADKPCLQKHSKMYRRLKRRGGKCLKGGAAKRWHWLAKFFD